MPGVVRTRVGYSGGEKQNPTYHSLGDQTETVEVDYDPARVSYAALLAVFWDAHDPFARTASRQYRAVVFYHDAEQQRLAGEARDRLEAQSGRKVQTEILPAGRFWLAEDYHQKYYLRHSSKLTGELAAYYPGDQGFTGSTVAARLNGYLGGFGTGSQLRAELPLYGLSPASQDLLLRLAPKLEP